MIRSIRQLCKYLLMPLFIGNLCACADLHTDRNVFVNHERQGAFGVAAMDQKTGMFLPDGNYWVDWVSGNWGVEGSNKILGNVHAAAIRASGQAQRNGSGSGGNSGSVSASQNGIGATGRDAQGKNCATVSLPNGQGMISCH